MSTPTYEYGITISAGVYGLLQNVEEKHKINHKPYYGPDGEVAGYTDSDEQYEITAEFLYDTTTTISAGDCISAGSGIYHINSKSDKGVFNDHRKLSFEGVRYVKNTIPAAAGTYHTTT